MGLESRWNIPAEFFPRPSLPISLLIDFAFSPVDELLLVSLVVSFVACVGVGEWVWDHLIEWSRSETNSAIECDRKEILNAAGVSSGILVKSFRSHSNLPLN